MIYITQCECRAWGQDADDVCCFLRVVVLCCMRFSPMCLPDSIPRDTVEINRKPVDEQCAC